MGYFVAVLEMKDASRNEALRPQHLAYLEQCEADGKMFACGPFVDGSGGMIIYKADSFAEAEALAKADPYVKEKVRTLKLREWNMRQNL